MNNEKAGVMEQLRPMPRRLFLQGSLAVTGSAAIIVSQSAYGLAQDIDPPASPLAIPGSPAAAAAPSLSNTELATLRAAVDLLIPPDVSPGAVDAGVDEYIANALTGRYAALAPTYQAGLAAFEQAAGSGGFAALTTDAQEKILTNAEAGSLDSLPDGFFALLLAHTREGMFSDPIYGGNKNFAGWDLIGYPGIKLTWTPEDQAIGSTPVPEHISVEHYGGAAL